MNYSTSSTSISSSSTSSASVTSLNCIQPSFVYSVQPFVQKFTIKYLPKGDAYIISLNVNQSFNEFLKEMDKIVREKFVINRNANVALMDSNQTVSHYTNYTVLQPTDSRMSFHQKYENCYYKGEYNIAFYAFTVTT